jgi:hypothetical protein
MVWGRVAAAGCYWVCQNVEVFPSIAFAAVLPLAVSSLSTDTRDREDWGIMDAAGVGVGVVLTVMFWLVARRVKPLLAKKRKL